MIIRSISVKNFKKLIGPVRISGLTPEVNVIAGDNEEGKSTLFSALRSAFFLKHSTTGQAVEGLLPYGAQVKPEVSVDFEMSNGLHSLTKSFCYKPFVARLKTPEGSFEGAAVEEHLQQLLMCPAGGAKKSDPDRGVWGLLWLEQTAALEGLSMTDGGRQTLIKAVESDIGTVLGGQNGRALMAAVTKLHSDFFTAARSDATKDYKKAKDAVQEISVELENSRRAYREYESKVEDLTAKRDEKARMRRENSLAKAKEKMLQAEEQLAKLDKFKQDLESCTQADRTVRAECATIKQLWDSRLLIKADLEKSSKEKELADTSLLSARAEAELLRTKQEHAQAEIAELQKNIAEMEDQKRKLLVAQTRLKHEQDKKEISDRLAAAREKQAELNKVVNEFNSIKIDEKALLNLRTLARAAGDADAKAAAASTKIVLHPNKGRSATIMGESLEDGETLLLSENSTLELQDWGTIDVHPGGENAAAKRKEAKKLEAQLQSALANARVESIEQAEETVQKRLQLKNAGELLGGELKLLVPSGIKALEAQLKQIEDDLAQSEQSDVSFDPQRLNELERALQDALRQQAAESKNLAALTAQTHQAELSSRESAAKSDAALKLMESNQARLNSMSLEESDENLKARLENALHNCSIKERELAAAKSAFEALEPVKIRDAAEAARKEHNAIQLQLDNLDRNIDILAAEVETLGKQGPGEKLQEFEGKYERAVQQLESMDRQARAVKLLFETMKECESKAKEQFMLPVQTRLRPYLNELFPGADVALDQAKFEIAGLHRGDVPEKYTSLSVGTREQISVLTRLAIACMLKEKGYPAVVVLDDALVYSDERRFDLMKQVLRRTSKEAGLQILILTCRKRDYLDFDNIFDLSESTAGSLALNS